MEYPNHTVNELKGRYIFGSDSRFRGIFMVLGQN